MNATAFFCSLIALIFHAVGAVNQKDEEVDDEKAHHPKGEWVPWAAHRGKTGHVAAAVAAASKDGRNKKSEKEGMLTTDSCLKA